MPALRVRRCAIVLFEPREVLDLDVAGLFAGGNAVRAHCRWVALAPHLEAEVDIDEDELVALGRIGETPWLGVDELAATTCADVVERLLAKGLLVGDGDAHCALRARDEQVRAAHWKPLSAVAHAFSRWRATDVADDARIPRDRTLADLVAEFGMPPTHQPERVPIERRVKLAAHPPSRLDALFRARATCRNFDPARALPRAAFEALLQRAFGCHASSEALPGVRVLKKANPSGGGLHALEAYLLVRNVDGLAPGLHHYHALDHALEPLATLDAGAARALATRFVAGQDYFASAAAHVVIVARFGRLFWKYRNHAKAWRVLLLEAGHVSQNLQLAATELGLGAYVTAAINEVDIERAFGLDALGEGPLAVCGFGTRAAQRSVVEFDPLGEVWDGDARRRRDARIDTTIP
jgi:putative peptide maturation dehydrogenase